MLKKSETEKAVNKIAFGEFELWMRPLRLTRNGELVDAQLKTLKFIALLARKHGALVTHDEIHHALWNGRAMDVHSNIHVCVRQARAAIGDNAAAPSFIENVPGQGYRFVAPAEILFDRLPRKSLQFGALHKKQNLIAPACAVFALLVLAPAMMFAADQEQLSDHSQKRAIAESAFAQGISLAKRDDLESLRQSITYFDAALEADETFSDAQIAASKVYWRMGQFNDAAASAHEALSINDSLSDAYTMIGLVELMHDWDWDGALNNLARGLSRNTESADAHHGLGTYYAIRGNFELAEKHLQESFRLSGGAPIARAHLGWVHIFAGDYDRAAEVCGQNQGDQAMPPEQHRCFIKALAHTNQFDEARLQISAFMKAGSAKEPEIEKIAHTADADLLAAFDAWRFQTLEQAKGTIPQSSAHLAFAAAGARNYEQALFYARLAINEHCSMIPFIAVDPVFTPISGDPNFQKLVQRLRLN